MPKESRFVMRRAKHDGQSSDIRSVEAGEASHVNIFAIKRMLQHRYHQNWLLPPTDRSARTIAIGHASTLAGPVILIAAGAIIVFWL